MFGHTPVSESIEIDWFAIQGSISESEELSFLVVSTKYENIILYSKKYQIDQMSIFTISVAKLK